MEAMEIMSCRLLLLHKAMSGGVHLKSEVRVPKAKQTEVVWLGWLAWYFRQRLGMGVTEQAVEGSYFMMHQNDYLGSRSWSYFLTGHSVVVSTYTRYGRQ